MNNNLLCELCDTHILPVINPSGYNPPVDDCIIYVRYKGVNITFCRGCLDVLSVYGYCGRNIIKLLKIGEERGELKPDLDHSKLTNYLKKTNA